MYFNKLSLFLVLIGLSVSTFAQDVLWADKVLGFSSELRPANYGQQYRAIQILGAPNKLPDVGDSPCAWSPATADTYAEEWIKVGFEKALPVRQVIIAENVNAGAVVRVYGYDANGKEYLLRDDQALASADGSGRVLRVVPSGFSGTSINAVKVVLSPSKVRGFNQIDAIGISSGTDPVKVEIQSWADAPKEVVRENLGKGVNTKAKEVAPVISPDGNTLFFTRNKSVNAAGEALDQDVFSSTWDGKKWSDATAMKEPINNSPYNNAVVGVSPQGKTLYLLNVYKPDGTMVAGISKSFLTASGWSFPVELKINGYYNLDKQNTMEFALSPKGGVIILAIERRDTQGGKDLYVCFERADGSWSDPQNMGDVINSADAETSPFLAADDKTLYFTSFGHRGFGTGDIFISKRLDDTWLNWSKPLNLGKGINTRKWDGYFSVPASGEYAYLSSSENTVGQEDIFRVQLFPSIRPELSAVVEGTVANIDTRKPIRARVVLQRKNSGITIDSVEYDPEVADYKILVNGDEPFQLTWSADGYVSYSEEIILSKEKLSGSVRRTILLNPVKPGKKIRLDQIMFGQSSARLDTSSYAELDRIYALMKQYPQMEVLLEGHTDNQGDFNKNLKLSEERVISVREYLVRKGIQESRVQIKAWGASRPITNNMTEEQRKQNRRVEFTILKL